MTTDWSHYKHRQAQTWNAGDYALLGGNLTIVSEMLCEAVDARAGQLVLDVATGSGNTALAAARRWCEVTGVDFAAALLERARERAAVERLPITFFEGDAENLRFPNEAFDVVLSTFGVMFAPNQAQAANELLRVCRRGGKIGLANWTPNSFLSQLPRFVSQYITPRAPAPSPFLWGDEAHVRALFKADMASLQITKRNFIFRNRSPQHFVDMFRNHFGPVMTAFNALDSAQQEALARDILVGVTSRNQSGDETLLMPSEYLEVVIVKK
jgi:ubiquinone/menaquinone biosynthesis C-methylase UbiE